MTQRQIKEHNERAIKYRGVIDLLINGFSTKDTVLLYNSKPENKNNTVSENTVRKIKREFIDNEDRYSSEGKRIM